MGVISRLHVLRDSVAGLADLVLPLRCAGCGAAGSRWCGPCRRELGGLRRVERPLLGPDPPAYALGRYRGAPRRAVLAYKESGRRDLAIPFGRCMATGLGVLAAEHDGMPGTGNTWWLVPAPSRAPASRQRGGAHMRRVAHRTASALDEVGRPVSVADCLVLGRGAQDSVGLGTAERVRNLSGRVLLRKDQLPPQSSPVVVIDDVITTGATAAGCVGALERSGIRVSAVLALTTTAR